MLKSESIGTKGISDDMILIENIFVGFLAGRWMTMLKVLYNPYPNHLLEVKKSRISRIKKSRILRVKKSISKNIGDMLKQNTGVLVYKKKCGV